MLRCVGHPVAVNPDAELLRVAREEGWQVMTFDRLRRRLRIAAAAGAVAAVAAAAGRISAQLRPQPKTKRVRRLLPG